MTEHRGSGTGVAEGSSEAPAQHRDGGRPALPLRLTDADLAAVDAIVAPADERTARLYPGDRLERQPVHTVYVPGDRMTPDLSRQWGAGARAALDEHAPGAGELMQAAGLKGSGGMARWAGIWRQLLHKLESEPIEDLRIDFEDGYGDRGDAVEDADVVSAARALVAAGRDGLAPPSCGIRFKALEAGTRRRGLRSLDLFLATMLGEAGVLPPGWVVTLPKVTSIEQVQAMAEVCTRLETAYALPAGRLRFEVQVETPQAIVDHDGSILVARIVHEAAGRLTGLHFGTYDYTAALGVAGPFQALDHPAADHAKQVMALAVAGTGVRLSDGSTNVLPVGDRAQVHRGWALHARLVGRALALGYYQGWDLHPAQLVTRYTATYLYFHREFRQVASQLGSYARGDQGSVVDEPATAQALARFALRAVDCGAFAPDDLPVDLEIVRGWAARKLG